MSEETGDKYGFNILCLFSWNKNKWLTARMHSVESFKITDFVSLPYGPASCDSIDVTDVLITLTGEVQGRLSSLTEQEKVSREQCIALRSTVSALESRLAAVTKEAAQYKTELELQQARFNQLQQAKDRYVQAGYRVQFMFM
jgi:hypothetical protein